MTIYDRIYFSCPRKFQHLISSFLTKIYLPFYLHGLYFFYGKLWYSYTKICLKVAPDRYKNYLFRKIVHHAYQTVPFYRKKWKSHGVHPSEIKTLRDLKKLPILHREDVAKNFTALHSNKTRTVTIKPTSGTTGKPIKVALDRKTTAYRTCMKNDYLKAAGLEVSDLHINVSGDEFALEIDGPIVKKNLKFQEIYFSAYANSEKHFQVLFELIEKHKPKYILCLPSFMYSAAEYAIITNQSICFGTLISDRENLHDFQKKKNRAGIWL